MAGCLLDGRAEEMKYKTLKELKAAYESGKLSKECPLILDNDCVHVRVKVSGDDYDGEYDRVFGKGYMPSDVLEAALDMLGIPWEHC